MSNKYVYSNVVSAETSLPLSLCDWWLDSVVGSAHWDVALVTRKSQVIAAMPYFFRRQYGFRVITMPPLTQVMGPWIEPSEAKYARRLALEKDLMRKLIGELPRFDYFSQHWHYSQQNWLPFYWAGFNQTTRYTYVIEGLKDLERVFRDFSSSYRNKIRKADKLIEVKTDLDIDSFFRIYAMTFERQGLRAPCKLQLLRGHDAALAERRRRKIFYAVDVEGRVHSALYLTWDSMSSYVHMVGEDPKYRNSGAGIRLIWEAIRYTSRVLDLDKLDFEGSMIEGVERVRRDCGAKQVPYFAITKVPSRILAMKWCVSALSRRR